MDYNKPKVTIDLNEYADMKKEIADNKASEASQREKYLLNIIFEMARKSKDTTTADLIYKVHDDKYGIAYTSRINPTENPFEIVSK